MSDHDELREVADMVGDHAGLPAPNDPEHVICRCNGVEYERDQHNAHIADALVPLIREREAGARAEAERNLRDWRDECLRWRDDAEQEPARLKQARAEGVAAVTAAVGPFLSDPGVQHLLPPNWLSRLRAALADLNGDSGGIRLGSCCLNVGTDECACPPGVRTNWGLADLNGGGGDE